MAEQIAAPQPAAPDTKAGATPVASAGAAPASPEKLYKLKVNGMEREYTEAQLIERAQKAEGSEERFKMANNILEAIKRNPVDVLTNPAIGVDIKKVALDALKRQKNMSDDDRKELTEWFYENIVKREQMDPKEREALSWKEKAELLENEKKEREEKEKSAKLEAETKAAFQNLMSELAKEIPTSGLPFSAELKSPNDADLVRRIGRKLQIGLSQGKQISVKDAINLVKSDLRAEHNAMARFYNEDNLHEFYDQDVMEKFNKAMLKKFKAAEKEKAKEESAKQTEEPRREYRDKPTRQAAREADKLIRKISTGRF